MKTTTALFPLRSALLCLLLGLATTASLSAADPTSASIGPATARRDASPYLSAATAPANATLDTAKSTPPAEATSTVASSTLSPFIARPAPASNVAASPDTTKTTNPADKPQYVFTWFLNNYLGTTIASSNAAEEIAEIETDAFGAPLARGTLPADMRYTGKPYDEDMGAYIFPFRNYRPDEARWMTPDPSGFPDGPNNRVYAGNPIINIDPTGLFSLTGWAPSPATATTAKDYDGNTHTVSISAYSNPLGWADFTGNPQSVITAGSFTTTFSSSNDVTLEIDTLAAEGQQSGGYLGRGENIQVTATGGLSSGTNHWIQFVQWNCDRYNSAAHSNYVGGVTYCDCGISSTDPFYDDTFIPGSDSWTFFDFSSSDFDPLLGHRVSAIAFSAELFYVNVNASVITVYGGFSYNWNME